MAARDLLEPALEGVHLVRRLVVHVPQRRLAEVGDLGAGEPADESLRADDPDLGVANLEDHVAPIEDEHAGLFEYVRDLVAATGMVVVVSEDRDDRDRDGTTRPREHGCLLGEAVCRQVTCEQHEVGLIRDLGERPLQALSERLDGMDVARCGDANGRGHETSGTRPERSANAESG